MNIFSPALNDDDDILYCQRTESLFASLGCLFKTIAFTEHHKIHNSSKDNSNTSRPTPKESGPDQTNTHTSSDLSKHTSNGQNTVNISSRTHHFTPI